MPSQRDIFIATALSPTEQTGCDKLFLFLNNTEDCQRLFRSGPQDPCLALVVPSHLGRDDPVFAQNSGNIPVIRSWSGNQTRFSRIKYAFLQGVRHKIITAGSKVICVLGPWGSNHLDTLTIHDLSLSWSEHFPFDPRLLIDKDFFHIVLAVLDIALDIGALGREGKSLGTILVIGDSAKVLNISHQAVFNPFKGYPEKERAITRAEVVESIKELAKLDGAIIISSDGVVVAAGRHLDAAGVLNREFRGLGARHRAAAGISAKTKSVAIVVSESTGRVTLFVDGRIISSFEPVISRRIA